MLENHEVIRLTFGDSLAYGHLRQACYTLRQGGLCILPSDTCYSLAALPFRRDALAHLASILPGKEADPIPLAFGSLALVEQYVRLTPQDEKLIDAYCPGPLTLVCEINDKHNKKIIEDMLHTHGTIGVRIPDSAVERQISIEQRIGFQVIYEPDLDSTADRGTFLPTSGLQQPIFGSPSDLSGSTETSPKASTGCFGCSSAF